MNLTRQGHYIWAGPQSVAAAGTFSVPPLEKGRAREGERFIKGGKGREDGSGCAGMEEPLFLEQVQEHLIL